MNYRHMYRVIGAICINLATYGTNKALCEYNPEALLLQQPP